MTYEQDYKSQFEQMKNTAEIYTNYKPHLETFDDYTKKYKQLFSDYQYEMLIDNFVQYEKQLVEIKQICKLYKSTTKLYDKKLNMIYPILIFFIYIKHEDIGMYELRKFILSNKQIYVQDFIYFLQNIDDHYNEFMEELNKKYDEIQLNKRQNDVYRNENVMNLLFSLMTKLESLLEKNKEYQKNKQIYTKAIPFNLSKDDSDRNLRKINEINELKEKEINNKFKQKEIDSKIQETSLEVILQTKEERRLKLLESSKKSQEKTKEFALSQKNNITEQFDEDDYDLLNHIPNTHFKSKPAPKFKEPEFEVKSNITTFLREENTLKNMDMKDIETLKMQELYGRNIINTTPSNNYIEKMKKDEELLNLKKEEAKRARDNANLAKAQLWLNNKIIVNSLKNDLKSQSSEFSKDLESKLEEKKSKIKEIDKSKANSEKEKYQQKNKVIKQHVQHELNIAKQERNNIEVEINSRKKELYNQIKNLENDLKSSKKVNFEN